MRGGGVDVLLERSLGWRSYLTAVLCESADGTDWFCVLAASLLYYDYG